MHLITGVVFGRDDVVFVSFYDQDACQGFSITRNAGDEKIEVMVADQSCYRVADFELKISPGKLKATLPSGTIDPADGGDDHYNIEYDFADGEYPQLIAVLRLIFENKSGLSVVDTVE